MLTAFDHGELVVSLRVATDRGLDGALQRIKQPLRNRVIDLLDRALLELVLQRRVRALALGHDHQAGGADIKAMHNPLTLGSPRG